MLAARKVEKRRPGPSVRPATKKSRAPVTRRAMIRPSAICAVENSSSAARYHIARASEGRRCVDPEQHRVEVPRIEPAMRVRAREPEAVAFAQHEALELVEPDFERAGHHEDELLALMRVGAFAAGERGDAEEHR